MHPKVDHHIETTHTTEAHQIIIDPTALVALLKGNFCITLFLLFNYLFTRLSVLSLFLRLFPNRYMRVATYFLIGFVCVQTLAYAIAAILSCRPVSFFWEQATPEAAAGLIQGKCSDLNAIYRSITPPNIFTDVALIVLPLPQVWALDATRARRFGLTALFMTGLACLVASAFRQWVYESHTVQYETPVLTNVLVTWLVVEPSVYLFASCLLAMHPLFRLAVPRSWSRAVHQRHHHAPAGSTGRHGAVAARSDFARLMDYGDGPAGVSSSAAARADFAADGKPSRQGSLPGSLGRSASGGGAVELEDGAKRGSDAPSEVPLEDMRDVHGGMGVLVKTEVSVTAEERFERVLGI